MANLGNVIKISQADFDTLFNAYPNAVTIHSQSVTYDPNSIYLIDNQRVLLWGNSNPSANLAAGTLSLNDHITDYKYIIIKWKQSKGDYFTRIECFENGLYNASSVSTNAFWRLGFVWSGGVSTRYINGNNGLSSLALDDCWACNDGSSSRYTDNADCFILAIYGTNSLL